jgi:hypothetical protein
VQIALAWGMLRGQTTSHLYFRIVQFCEVVKGLKVTHQTARYICALSLFLAASSVYGRPHTRKELKPLLENRCYLSKTPADRADFLKQVKALSNADFAKTMKDLEAINAGDRLLGTKGCDNHDLVIDKNPSERPSVQ